jgi:hypothetical protein
VRLRDLVLVQDLHALVVAQLDLVRAPVHLLHAGTDRPTDPVTDVSLRIRTAVVLVHLVSVANNHWIVED